MANLRADNLTGTGGRNALDGSVFFNGSMNGTSTDPQDYLALADSDDFFLSGDFSMEAWVYLSKAPAANNYAAIATQWESGGGSDRSVMLFAYHYNNDFYFKADLQTSAGNFSVSGPDLTENGLTQTWHHLAWERNSNTLTLYLNGVSVGTATASGTTNNSTVKFMVGAEDNGSGVGIYGWNGYISNFRICNGHAVYKANFTPPTQKLGLHPETVLLCCQDSDNALQEATGKTITGYGRYTNTDTELVTNHSFNNGTTGWTLSDASEGSMAVVNGSLVLTNDDSSDPPVYAWQAVTTVVGQTYDLKVHFSGGTGTPGSNLAIYLNTSSSFGSSAGGSMTADSVSGNGIKIHRFKATVATTYLILRVNANAAGTSIFSAASMKASDPGKAPKVLPPYGIDEGVVVDGYTKINSPGVMYFPT